MTDLVNQALVIATLGQIGFCVSFLMVRPKQTRAWAPLCVFFLACAFIISDSIIATFFPSLRLRVFVFSLPAYLIISPALWLYVQGLTAEKPWEIKMHHAWHLIPFLLGLLIAVLVVSLPQATLEQVFFEEDLDGSLYLGILFTATFLLILFLTAQSAFYVFKIFRSLTLYRRRMKEQFANVEDRELFWINGVLILFIGIWVIFAVGIVGENVFNKTLFTRRIGAFIALTLVWFVGLWGLRQQPGFEGRYQEISLSTAHKHSKPKYNRSALDKDRAQRIVKKIESAMQKDKLYLDPNLSLSKLAKHIGATANHVSQSLNETVEMTFFDYVNKWRIDTSKQKILESNDTILTIALSVGFNASSSFYKAFKKETGLTPRGFRNSA